MKESIHVSCSTMPLREDGICQRYAEMVSLRLHTYTGLNLYMTDDGAQSRVNLFLVNI